MQDPELAEDLNISAAGSLRDWRAAGQRVNIGNCPDSRDFGARC